LLASTLVGVGPRPGDGQAAKTVNQLLCGVHIAATAEALLLAQRMNLELETTLAALQAGAADSFMLRTRGPRVIEGLEHGKPTFSSRLDLFVKDLAIVSEAADAAELELPMLAAARSLFDAAEAEGLGDGDDSGVALASTLRRDR
jgi:3-hydroxyisobutyrate dehydrogenase